MKSGGHEPPAETVRSAAMQRVLAHAATYAEWRAPIVIQGEVGTGKTWLASHIHRLSPRRGHPFREFNLAQPDLSLISSDLFGHVAGGFTDAKRDRAGLLADANKGTVFFDEVGKCPLPMQYKLLPVLDSATFVPVGADRPLSVDVRFIFAAREPLRELAASGAIAVDFLSRLGLLRLALPPLRERRADIIPLAEWFVRKTVLQKSEVPRMHVPALSNRLREALLAHTWPENVRELEEVMLSLVVHSGDDRVLDLPLLRGDFSAQQHLAQASPAERKALALQALARVGGVKVRAAKVLGWSLSKLQRVLRAGE